MKKMNARKPGKKSLILCERLTMIRNQREAFHSRPFVCIRGFSHRRIQTES
jgi:hypothetical protein